MFSFILKAKGKKLSSCKWTPIWTFFFFYLSSKKICHHLCPFSFLSDCTSLHFKFQINSVIAVVVDLIVFHLNIYTRYPTPSDSQRRHPTINLRRGLFFTFCFLSMVNINKQKNFPPLKVIWIFPFNFFFFKLWDKNLDSIGWSEEDILTCMLPRTRWIVQAFVCVVLRTR